MSIEAHDRQDGVTEVISQQTASSSPVSTEPGGAAPAMWREMPRTAPPESKDNSNAVLRRRRQRLLIASAMVVAIGALAIWYRQPIGEVFFGRPAVADTVLVSGNIEAHESTLSFAQIQAPIVELPFNEGQTVRSGDIVARVDDRFYRQQADIDRSALKAAIAQVSVGQSNLNAAQHIVASDEFDLAGKQREYARAEQLVKSDAVSQQDRDLALTAKQQSSALLARDQSLMDVAAANIRLANENVRTAQARVELDETTLAYTMLRAPFTGVIAVREAELGQLAAPGVAIFTLADLDHIWLRAYLNEPDVGKVRLGTPVDVTTDTYPGRTYSGRISFISPKAEFTPKTVETHAERVTLVYRVRIDIDNPNHVLLPGMPADAAISIKAERQ